MIYDDHETRRFHRDLARRMAEPDDLQDLRRQADRIQARRALAARSFGHEIEKGRLRQQIRKAGEQPCR